jgi:RNA polymerase sigma-70 factor (ECF subfamily)
MGPVIENRDLAFDSQRRRMFGIAYRILGSKADAEDIVQESYLRWQRADEEVRSPEAWLTTVVTRLAVDRLRSAQSRREVYVGSWLPEPIVERHAWSPGDSLDAASDLSIAFLYLMESLSPDERAAFVLREGFDYPYDEVAGFLDKSQAACRQLVHRAKERLRQDRRRQQVDPRAHAGVVRRYVDAVMAGDENTLLGLLAEDVRELSDGGGKARAALHPIEGADRVARLILGLTRKYEGRFSIEPALVNSEPGVIIWFEGSPVVASFETDGERIVRIFHMLNPDNLGGLQTATG